MNDLDALERFGPRPSALTDDALAAARARLAGEIDAEDGAGRRRPQRTVALLVAAAAALAAVVVPVMVGADRNVALAAVDPLSFPWTPQAVPAGLGEPVFEKDPGFVAAHYGGQGDGLSVVTEVDDAEFWTIPDAARHVSMTEDGAPARVYRRPAPAAGSGQGDDDAVTVVWEDDSHGWTAVTGTGDYASAEAVLAFANGLHDESQSVDLPLRLAPEGWTPVSYRADRALVLTESGAPESDALVLTLIDRAGSDLSSYGVGEESPVNLEARQGVLGRQQGGADAQWILEGVAKGGQAFSLQAPGDLSQEQVIEIANGVTSARH